MITSFGSRFQVLSFFVLLLLLIGCRDESCGGGDEISAPCCEENYSTECCAMYPQSACCTTTDTLAAVEIDSINFYLENSHSMGGYFQTRTDFYANIDKIITDLILSDNYRGQVNTYTIAEQREKYAEVSAFRNQLDPTNDTRIAIAKSSPLHDILGEICAASGENSINLFVTDGIPSGTNAQVEKHYKENKSHYNIDFTDNLKNDIKVTIDQNCNNHAVKILAFYSNFKSTSKHPYFKLDNNQTTKTVRGTFTNRPYYIFAIGKPELIDRFFAKAGNSFQPEEEMNIGFKYAGKTEPTGFYIKGTNNSRVSGDRIEFTENNNGGYRFGLLADLKNFPKQIRNTDYIDINLAVYVNGKEITSKITAHDLEKSTEGLMLKNTQTKTATEGYSHLLEVELPDYVPGTQDKLSVKLKNSVPQWYKKWSSASDLKIQLDDSTSFGFDYVVEGILEAYKEDRESFLLEQDLKTVKK